MKKPFKLKSQGAPFKMVGASSLEKPKTFTPYNPYSGVGTKLWSGAKSTGKFIGKKILSGPVGAAVTAYEVAKPVAEWMGRSWNKAENVNMNAPENVKLAEYKYGSSDKSKNIGKSKQIKKGDKIRVMGPDRY